MKDSRYAKLGFEPTSGSITRAELAVKLGCNLGILVRAEKNKGILTPDKGRANVRLFKPEQQVRAFIYVRALREHPGKVDLAEYAVRMFNWSTIEGSSVER